MYSVALDLNEPHYVYLDNCNQSVIFTLELINKDRNTMSLTVINLASKDVRVISKSDAKAQIQKALANLKKGIVRF